MGDEMRVAIHQPHYWPWLGYLKKMKEADIFVYLDEAAYTKNGFINRNKIQIDGKDHWLTIPVLTKGRMGQAIKDVEVNWDTDWIKKHHNSLFYNYPKMMGVSENGLHDFFLSKPRYKKLMKWCIESVRFLRIAYGINPMIIFESTLNIEGFGTERLVNICKKLNADTYLSGPSGRDYLDESKFANIKVEYMDWNPPTDLSALHHYLMGETEALEEEINAP